MELETSPKRIVPLQAYTLSLETQEMPDDSLSKDLEFLKQEYLSAFEAEELRSEQQSGSGSQTASSQPVSLNNTDSLALSSLRESQNSASIDLGSLPTAGGSLWRSESSLQSSQPESISAQSTGSERGIYGDEKQSTSITIDLSQGEHSNADTSSEHTIDVSALSTSKPEEENPDIPPSFNDASRSETTWSQLKEEARKSKTVGIGVLFTDALSNFHIQSVENSRGLEFFPEYEALGYGLCFSASKGRPSFLPLNLPTSINADEMWEFLLSVLEDESIVKYIWNAKDTLKPILKRKRDFRPRSLFDPQVAAWLISPELFDSYNSFTLVTSHYLKDKSFPNRLPAINLGRDLLLAMQLSGQLDSKLRQEQLYDIFVQQEMPLLPLLSLMELDGIGFDNSHLLAAESQLREMMKDLEKLAVRVCGFPINLGSPKHVAEIIFNKLKLRPPKHKERRVFSGRRVSTTEAILKSLAGQHPLPDIILRYRHVQKFWSNWITSLNQRRVVSELHSTWSQTSAATGRIVSSRPNLQNLPRASLVLDSVCTEYIGSLPLAQVAPSLEAARTSPPSISVRSAFFARPGMVLVGADFSQLEMRLLAHVANEESLIEFFRQGKDIHTLVAARWMNKPIEKVTSDDRNSAKRLVYGVMYGMGPISLADHLGVGYDVAKRLLSQFLDAYPAVQRFIEQTKILARARGWVRTLFGRRRLLQYDESIQKDYAGMDLDDLDDIYDDWDGTMEMNWLGADAGPTSTLPANSPSSKATASYLNDVKKPDRQAVNSIIQGTAADIVKRAMLNIDEDLRALIARENSSEADTKAKERDIPPADPEGAKIVDLTEPTPQAKSSSQTEPNSPGPIRLLLQIHDELIYECPKHMVLKVAEIIKRNMEHTVSFSVPLTVQLRQGPTWGEMKSIKLADSAPIRIPAGFSDASYQMDSSAVATNSTKHTSLYAASTCEESNIPIEAAHKTTGGASQEQESLGDPGQPGEAENLLRLL